MNGEERRRWLQRIRRRVAEHNDIVYMQAEQHEKNCAGDCRVCQAEARYIDQELRRKAKLGDEVRLASILSELLMDVDLTIGVCGKSEENRKPQPSIIYIQSVNKNETVSDRVDSQESTEKRTKKKGTLSIEEMNLTVHLDSTLKKFGIRNTDDLYVMLKGDSINMKKKLRGGYRYLVERLKELGYEITEEMG